MRYQSTVFGQLLKAVPRGWFEREAERHRTGRAKRTLSSWGHLVAMVLAQVSGMRSLRDVERLIERHAGVLPHLGLATLRRSTLSDANAARPAALFAAVAHKLTAALAARGRRGEAIRLIDATRIFAGKRIESWTGSGGIKLHMVFEPQNARPVCFAVTPERINDITAAKLMPIESGATYVFDKGYYDFAFWARLDALNCRFVTRLKKNSPSQLIEERAIEGGNILFDRIVTLSQRLSSQRRNPYSAPVRLVGVRIDTGRQLILVTNDLEASAAEIAQLYKTRWQIELFFKWIKQNLRLTHFLGTSRNAVTIQIMAALIGYLLLTIASVYHAAANGLQAIARLMPATLLARRSFADLLRPPDPAQNLPATPQLQLTYA
jgi:hypothetical protein